MINRNSAGKAVKGQPAAEELKDANELTLVVVAAIAVQDCALGGVENVEQRDAQANVGDNLRVRGIGY